MWVVRARRVCIACNACLPVHDECVAVACWLHPAAEWSCCFTNLGVGSTDAVRGSTLLHQDVQDEVDCLRYRYTAGGCSVPTTHMLDDMYNVSSGPDARCT